MPLYPNRVEQHLQQSLLGCYLVFGEEPQQKLDVISALRDKAKQQGFDERLSFVVDKSFDWQQFEDAANAMSLFASQQLIELEIPEGKPGKEGSQALLRFAEAANPDVMLVIHGGKIGKDVQNTKWFKTLLTSGEYVPCYSLEGKQLTGWLAQRAKVKGLQIGPDAVAQIAEFCAGNLLAGSQEIDKLLLAFPEQSPSLEQVQAALVDQSRFNVFQLMDQLLAGQYQPAIHTLNRLESEGVEPVIIIWAMVKEWQLLSQLSSMNARGESPNWNALRIWNNRKGLYQSALQRLSVEQLDELQLSLNQMDVALKQTSVFRPYISLCHICLQFLGLTQTPVNACPQSVYA